MLDKAEEASRSAPKRKRRVVGMRRRWIMGSVLPVIVILLLIAALTSVILVTNFYSNARSALESKARSGVSYFNTYVMVSYNEYYRNAVLYAKDFEDADTIELQFLDKNGRIDISSRGQTIGLTPGNHGGPPGAGRREDGELFRQGSSYRGEHPGGVGTTGI